MIHLRSALSFAARACKASLPTHDVRIYDHETILCQRSSSRRASVRNLHSVRPSILGRSGYGGAKRLLGPTMLRTATSPAPRPNALYASEKLPGPVQECPPATTTAIDAVCYSPPPKRPKSLAKSSHELRAGSTICDLSPAHKRRPRQDFQAHQIRRNRVSEKNSVLTSPISAHALRNYVRVASRTTRLWCAQTENASCDRSQCARDAQQTRLFEVYCDLQRAWRAGTSSFDQRF